MLSVRNCGRFRRHPLVGAGLVAANDAELGDNTPSLTDELVRTITITPAANEAVIARGVSGDVAFDGEVANNETLGARLSCKVIGLHGSPVQVAASSVIHNADNPLLNTVTGCTSDVFASGSISVEYVAPRGQAVSVEFYLRRVNSRSPSLSTMTSYCLRRTRVTYDLSGLSRHA